MEKNMNPSFFLSLHFLWILLAVTNLAVQWAHFRNDQSARLYTAKKITTPLLLLLALLIVILETKGFPLIPGAILLAMGLGELGMEGSDVVQSKAEGEGEKKADSIIVVMAGVLFLLVNLFIGITLIVRNWYLPTVLISLLISAVVLFGIFFLTIRSFKPVPETRTQMLLYLIGIFILFTGALVDINSGISLLGIAATILTVSDSLVLIRMGANFRKNTASGYKILGAFLVVILLLYYVYMGVLIQIGSPFAIFSV